MKSLMHVLAISLSMVYLVVGGNENLQAGSIVWGLNPVTGDIVRVNPKNGNILGSFVAPILPLQGDTRAGLSIADHGKTLLYQLGSNGPGLEIPGREILYGLDPFTGEIKFQEGGLGSSFGPDGISWQFQGDDSFIFLSHANPIPDIHRIENLGSPEEIEEAFWGPTYWATNNLGNFPVGGLGGDGNGREFGAFLDGFNEFGGHLYIGEYDPFISDPSFLNTFIAPSDDIVGLAFDGQFLYASSASGPLYTINPDTGEIIRTVHLPSLFFADGSPAPYQFDIAAMPEPTMNLLIILGIISLSITTWRYKRLS